MSSDNGMAIDKFLDNVNCGAVAPAYVVAPKIVYKQIRLYTNRREDIALEQVLDDWADADEQNKKIKLAIGMYYAAECSDIKWFEDNMKWFVAEVQLDGRIEMQAQIDKQQEQIDALLKRQNEHGRILEWLVPIGKWLQKKVEQLKIIKPDIKEEITDGN